jgi:hypothetical protein
MDRGKEGSGGDSLPVYTQTRIAANAQPVEGSMDGKHKSSHAGRIVRGLLSLIIVSAASISPAGRLSSAEGSRSQALPDAGPRAARVAYADPLPPATGEPPVSLTLSAGEASTSWDSSLPKPEPFELPVLYLNHDGEAAEEGERTLALALAGFAGEMEVEVEILSWHEDPTTREPHRESTQFRLPQQGCAAFEPCTIQWTLDAVTMLSDLYRLTLRDGDGNVLWQNPEPRRPDFVALDTWEVELGEYAVRIYYATLFPFARGEQALYHRLPPEAVHNFIAGQVAPIIIETWRAQFGEWSYGPIHPDWDADKVVEVIFTCLPFALLGGTGTYTVSTYADGSPYPQRRIWLQSSNNAFQAYDSLENGFRVVFSHEFHHIVQWNAILGAGCPAYIRSTWRWHNVFLEAQAKVASSVQYPVLEMGRDHLVAGSSEYSSAAQRFLSLRLKASFTELEAETADLYDAALYWRFLYEQTGSMDVLRIALAEMACRPVEDIPASLDEIMDAALARVDGPFATFEESITAFARANYALRLADGRCVEMDPRVCGERYYDPAGMYDAPLLAAALPYHGAPLTHDGSIPASYGSDLIEVGLDPALEGQSLRITFRGEGARFSVQAWALDSGPRAQRVETLSGDCSASCSYTIPHLGREQVDRIALIVVRLDPDEQVDPTGAYHLVVDAAR